MKNAIKILVLLCSIGVVSAIQDINITMDSGSVEMCIAIGNISNYVCNGNETLIVDGTRDYDYYLLPMQVKPMSFYTLSHDEEYLSDLITSPFYLIIALIGLVFPLLLGALIIYGLLSLTKKHGG